MDVLGPVVSPSAQDLTEAILRHSQLAVPKPGRPPPTATQTWAWQQQQCTLHDGAPISLDDLLLAAQMVCALLGFRGISAYFHGGLAAALICENNIVRTTPTKSLEIVIDQAHKPLLDALLLDRKWFHQEKSTPDCFVAEDGEEFKVTKSYFFLWSEKGPAMGANNGGRFIELDFVLSNEHVKDVGVGVRIPVPCFEVVVWIGEIPLLKPEHLLRWRLASWAGHEQQHHHNHHHHHGDDEDEEENDEEEEKYEKKELDYRRDIVALQQHLVEADGKLALGNFGGKELAGLMAWVEEFGEEQIWEKLGVDFDSLWADLPCLAADPY